MGSVSNVVKHAEHPIHGHNVFIFSQFYDWTNRRGDDGLFERVSYYQLITEGWVFE